MFSCFDFALIRAEMPKELDLQLAMVQICADEKDIDLLKKVSKVLADALEPFTPRPPLPPGVKYLDPANLVLLTGSEDSD